MTDACCKKIFYISLYDSYVRDDRFAVKVGMIISRWWRQAPRTPRSRSPTPVTPDERHGSDVCQSMIFYDKNTYSTYEYIWYCMNILKWRSGMEYISDRLFKKNTFTERSDKNTVEKPPAAMVPRRRKSRRITFSDAWKQVTLPETNIAPETRPSQKEMSFSNYPFPRAMLVSGRVHLITYIYIYIYTIFVHIQNHINEFQFPFCRFL